MINRRRCVVLALILGVAVVSCEAKEPQNEATSLSVALAPYQDNAMLVNAKHLGLEGKHGVELNLVSMAWEDIVPAIASAGRTVDVGFGSLTEFLTKYEKLNAGAADPVVFVQPLYVYHGGGFIGFDNVLSPLSAEELKDPEKLREVLRLRVGAQKKSFYEMILYTLAERAGVPVESLSVFDISMNDGLLALQSASIDLSAAGLTQMTEARKRGGRLIIATEDTGFADVTGFICRASVLQEKRASIEALVSMWFESVDYVFSDLSRNSGATLSYLQEKAATRYTVEEFRAALSQESLPRSLRELDEQILAPGSRFDFNRLAREISSYLVRTGAIDSAPPVPTPLLSARAG